MKACPGSVAIHSANASDCAGSMGSIPSGNGQMLVLMLTDNRRNESNQERFHESTLAKDSSMRR